MIVEREDQVVHQVALLAVEQLEEDGKDRQEDEERARDIFVDLVCQLLGLLHRARFDALIPVRPPRDFAVAACSSADPISTTLTGAWLGKMVNRPKKMSAAIRYDFNGGTCDARRPAM